ncbi:MAG TPA: hypothetical protein VMD02_07655, partial [Candidatus Omnitrophota bacterium]|nr:hypothetical protein [Candidatus Omnitrophota bacterium]
PALAVHRKRKVRYVRHTVRKVKLSPRRHFARITYRAYQEYFLSPVVKMEDEPVIIETLKEKGVNSARLDPANNSLILQFSSQIISALDIMKALKDLGYTVTSIN